MTTPSWKNIDGFNYQISNTGLIRRVDTRQIIKPHFHLGYAKISLSKDGKSDNKRISRLVAIAFIPNPENKRTVNHLDGNKTNNQVNNLEWATQSENMKHAHRMNLIAPKKSKKHL